MSYVSGAGWLKTQVTLAVLILLIDEFYCYHLDNMQLYGQEQLHVGPVVVFTFWTAFHLERNIWDSAWVIPGPWEGS